VAPAAAGAGEEIPFRFALNLNGTGSLSLTPVGRETTAHLQSQWETVSFSGNYLPSERDLTDGFSADWKIFDFNRSFPQAWRDDQYALGDQEYDAKSGGYTVGSPLTRSAFGADLRFPLDHYQLSMRSVKYAVMFIALTFFIFFLVELLSHRRIHPIQYLLVSCGLILFYGLLLALSEHIGFNGAYLVSAAAIVGLITAYATSIFKKRMQAIRMGLFLTVLYVYLYVMLQLENMALLFGAIGLFLALAIIMYVSRKINWYRNDEE
jgi:inner membrane protein